MCIIIILSTVQEFTNEVESHQEPISQLKAEGDALKGQGNQEDQRVVDRWLGDILKRYEDLTFSLDEREVCIYSIIC